MWGLETTLNLSSGLTLQIATLAVDAGKLGAVAGHAAHLGGHVEPHPGPARRSLLREADDPDRQADAHGPGRHPQKLGPQGHLHLPPQFRVEEAQVFSILSPRGSQMGFRYGHFEALIVYV